MNFIEDEISQAVRAQRLADANADRQELQAMGYRDDLNAQEQEVIRQQQITSDAHALYQFYRDQTGSPRVVACDANNKIIIAYFNGELLSPQAIQESLPNIRGLAYDDVGSIKDKLIHEYMAICPGSIEMQQSQSAKLKYRTVAEIASAIEALKEAKRLHALPVEAIRQLAKPQRPAVEDLPASFNRQNIMALPGSDLRKLILRYGSAAVTARINQR